MIEHTQENGENHYKYVPPTEDQQYNKVLGVVKLLNIFLQDYDDLDNSNFSIDYWAIGKIIVRIDQRRDKFKIFHDDTIMNEIKEVALWAYWIIKMKPLKINNKDLEIKHRFINENFAVFWILSVLKEEAKRNKQDFHLSEEYAHKLMYSLKYWSLGIDAFISMIEALNESPRHAA